MNVDESPSNIKKRKAPHGNAAVEQDAESAAYNQDPKARAKAIQADAEMEFEDDFEDEYDEEMPNEGMDVEEEPEREPEDDIMPEEEEHEPEVRCKAFRRFADHSLHLISNSFDCLGLETWN
jgi:hypothetical protein